MNKKVLIVDDNLNNIRLLKDILSDEGYIIYTSDNGAPVPDMVRGLRPDVILLDIMMPDISGFDLCKMLKRDIDTSDIPIIMVTAKTEGIDIKKALEYGAFDYIKKPVDEIELVARLQSALRYKAQQDELKEFATRDGLTGLFNHTLLLDLFEKELAKKQQNCNSTTFIMLDIDYFKKVNDTYGHSSGDLVLKELSDILASSIRRGDIVGRYGGEEFGIIIIDSTEEDVQLMCERIRSTIENYDFLIGNDKINITVSMGFCYQGKSTALSSGDLIKNADIALYKAKHKGRNRVEKYSENDNL
jgi:diguanylate cyclase (GGDEF) domain